MSEHLFISCQIQIATDREGIGSLSFWVDADLRNLKLILHVDLDDLYHNISELHFQATQIEEMSTLTIRHLPSH